MPDIKPADAVTDVMPARTQPPAAIYEAITRANQPKKSLADLGLERISLTHLDAEGNLKVVSTIILHDTLNQLLTIIEDGEIG